MWFANPAMTVRITFIYSKRTGTPAASIDHQIDEAVVKDRFDRLLATVNEISR